MSEKFLKKYGDLFEKKALASLATIMPDGRPQVTPVWVDFDGEAVIINTAVGRVKDRNLQRDGRATLAVIDPQNPYRYLEVRGNVIERTHEGADAHIDRMAKKYLSVETYPNRRPGEIRVIYRIRPEHFSAMG